MSLAAWIKSLLGSRKRDISRLSTSASGQALEDVDAVEESVSASSGPLKEHHRRRALRDRRLLPKVKSPARRLGLAKKRHVMTRGEADRLFGGTFRTRNRNLRDLLPDEEQLRRFGLPVWETEDDVAVALGISLNELRFFAIHRERERQPHYVTFSIPKRSGGKRLIMAPKRRLKMIQRKLLGLVVEKLPVSEHAHAFRRGRGIRTGAEPHVGRASVLKLDLKDFFPSITFARVRGLLIACGCGYTVATTLAVLMTEAERQPVEIEGELFHVPVGLRHCVQGAPTSPGISNALLLRMDHRMAGLAKKHNLTYSRYADDLAFSGDMTRAEALRLRQTITRIVEEEGFFVNTEKTRLMGRGTRQVVTGVVVNQTLGLSRQERRRLRACAHQLDRSPEEDPRKRDWLRGRLAYLSMLNPEQAARIRGGIQGTQQTGGVM
jgi:retron-type reverse transcriptase